MTVEVVLKRGADASKEERAAFEALVLQDPQVDPNGLSARIAKANILAFLYKDGELIGTGAIKHNPAHQQNVALHSGIPLPSHEFEGEIGYLHTAGVHRRQGHGDRVMASLIKGANGKKVFATIQTKNASSQRLLARHGYARAGKPWTSEQVDDDVDLYICDRNDK